MVGPLVEVVRWCACDHMKSFCFSRQGALEPVLELTLADICLPLPPSPKRVNFNILILLSSDLITTQTFCTIHLPVSFLSEPMC